MVPQVPLGPLGEPLGTFGSHLGAVILRARDNISHISDASWPLDTREHQPGHTNKTQGASKYFELFLLGVFPLPLAHLLERFFGTFS